MTGTTKTRKPKRGKTTREDVYTTVTNTIIRQLEQGVRPWLQPWSSGHKAGPVSRPLRHNGERYCGINILMLWMTSMERGFDCPLWVTFRQAQQLGGHVRKGEKGARVVYASTFNVDEEGSNGEDEKKDIPFLKQYTVFNADQCEGLPDRFYEQEQPLSPGLQPAAAVADFATGTKADVRIGGGVACYRPAEDHIAMPAIEAFRDAESHAATLCHELIHWSGHATRLNRDLGGKRQADSGYAREELVAELGAAFLSADLGITPEIRDDHASYLDHWLKVLKQDKRAIFQAASHASKAVDYLHSLQSSDVN